MATISFSKLRWKFTTKVKKTGKKYAVGMWEAETKKRVYTIEQLPRTDEYQLVIEETGITTENYGASGTHAIEILQKHAERYEKGIVLST